MITSSYAKQFSLLFLIIVVTISCSKETEIEKEELPASDFFVELSTIEEIASGIQFPADRSPNLKSTGPQTKRICSIEEIRNNEGTASIYVVNYDEGGFVLFSADKRTIPILGYSVDNNFEVDEGSYPTGLKYWMTDAKEQIEHIQISNIEQTPEVEIAWKFVQQSIIDEVTTLKSVPPDDCYDHTEIFTEGPFGIPTWHQESPYNDDLPIITCDGSDFQVLVGCMPLAMAMVMRYHQYPTTYNWSSMPYSNGTSSTAAFIEEIHDEINGVYPMEPIYYCDGTGVGSDMAYILKYRFDYSNAIYAYYNPNSVTNNIAYDRPVILMGTDLTYGGHAWVCNGYRRYIYYQADCSMVSSLHLHMVWGWGTDYIGYYAFDNFNPGNKAFNSNKKMIYNIIP
ncbi:MAG: C10 family peptidase [Bacteroidales bacterium]